MRLFEIPIAHRGLHDAEAPENSMAAFRKALEAGYNIETDVHLTKDNVLVAFHDRSLKRVVGQEGTIESLTFAELRTDKYRLPNGEFIPTFDELLQLVDGKVDILCELKSIGDPFRRLEKSVLAAVRDKPWVKVQAFNPLTIAWFKRNAPDICRGQLGTLAGGKWLQLVFALFGPTKMLWRSKPDFLAFDYGQITDPRVANAVKKYDMKLLCWTVKSQEEYDFCKAHGVDNIIFENFLPAIER